MSDIKCGRCADLKACTDHPEALVGSRWRPHSGPVVVRVVALFPGLTDYWCALNEDYNTAEVFGLARFDNWVRLPEVPAPSPTIMDEQIIA